MINTGDEHNALLKSVVDSEVEVPQSLFEKEKEEKNRNRSLMTL